MKTFYSILLSFLLLTNCKSQHKNTEKDLQTAQQIEQKEIKVQSEIAFDFENYPLGKLPEDWHQTYTGKTGETPDWQIVKDGDNRILAQLTSQNPNYHFNVIVNRNIRLKNMELSVKVKGVKGHKDQGGGFVWRYTDADNYYVVRENPLEDNVVLYKVVQGKRTDLPILGKGRTYGVDVKPLGNQWNRLKLIVVDRLFSVYLNDTKIFQVLDSTFTNAGKIGLWSKADAVSYFDDFHIKELDYTKPLSK